MAEETHVTKTTETQSTHAVYTEPKVSLLSNVLAIIGFIILIVIILWGLLHIATLSQPWLSSLFNTSSSLKVTAPASVTSGSPFTVSWKYSTSETGTYAFLYPCKSGFHFETASGSGMTSIPCGAVFTIGTTNKSVVVTPLLSTTASTSVPVSILFMPSATTSKQAQGSATVVVNPRVSMVVPQPTPSTPATPTPTPTTPTPTKPKPVTYRGPSDLSVRIIALTVDASGMAVATFDISNVGGSSSGVYYFSAQLPMSNYAQGYLPAQAGGGMQGQSYVSNPQSPLGPGDHVVNTLRFSPASTGVFSVAVGASDGKQSNNYASQMLSAPYYNNYTPQPYYYQTQPYQYPYVY